MARDVRETTSSRQRRRRSYSPRRVVYGVTAAFTRLLTFFSLAPATPREGRRSRRELRESSFASHRNLHRMVLSLTLLFVTVSLLISCSLVIYTAWNHDLRNGAFALVFAVLSAQVAMNWLLWRDEANHL